jgi:hypothetical protein
VGNYIGKEALTAGLSEHCYIAYIKVIQLEFIPTPLPVILPLEPQPSNTPSALAPEAVIFACLDHRVTLIAVETQYKTHPSPRKPFSFSSYGDGGVITAIQVTNTLKGSAL